MEFLNFITSAWAIPIFMIINGLLFLKVVAPVIMEEDDMAPTYFATGFFLFWSLVPIINVIPFIIGLCFVFVEMNKKRKAANPDRIPLLVRLVHWANK